MILVLNRLLQSNGNNFSSRGLLFLILVFFVASCTPRARVLSPNTETKPEVIEEKIEETPHVELTRREQQHITMLLPFELNRSSSQVPTMADIERSALALDFYQGFKLGLDVHAEEGNLFKLEVLDSRDDENEVARLASTEAVKNASIIIGPIYPKEIQAFGRSSGLSNGSVLQVNPLAASMPTEFNLSNLVSITSPIMTHVEALANQIVAEYKSGDVVILYTTEEASSQQFLPALRVELQKRQKSIPIHQVADNQVLLERLRHSGKNLIVCGSTNRFRSTAIINELHAARNEFGFNVQLFGHPNWAKMTFSDELDLEALQTVITSSYYINKGSRAVREFDERYQSEYHVAATEFAYKGYDAGFFFGRLLVLYGDDYKQHLIEATYDGLHNSFGFEYNPTWGYVNTVIHFLRYRNGEFVRVN